MGDALLKQVLNKYEIKRQKAIKEAEDRKNEVLKVNPKLSEIENEISKISIQTAKTVVEIQNEDEKKKLLAELKKNLNNLVKEKEKILKELSKSTDFFKPHYECNSCKDTGYIEKNGKYIMCNCLKQAIYDIAYNKSNMGNLERENFSTFNIRCFSDKPNKQAYQSDISPRENMNLIREKAYEFIENFDNPEEKNLVFTGGTGLGKTFLTNCIASEILKRGKTVLYQTAPVMLDKILDEKYGKTNYSFDLMENILTTDLLIIDDLGTEKINDNKITELFTIINTRLLNQNHNVTKTIISTNLTIKELFSNYTTRIGSRLANSYKFYRFFGEDIRLRK